MLHGNYYLFALRVVKFIHGSINRYVEKFRIGQIDEKVKKNKDSKRQIKHEFNL